MQSQSGFRATELRRGIVEKRRPRARCQSASKGKCRALYGPATEGAVVRSRHRDVPRRHGEPEDPRGTTLRSVDTARTSRAALVLITGLRTILTVTYVPLAANVALLDTTTSAWLLELDAHSSEEDHRVAMIDVFKVLSFGAQAAEFAVPSLQLRLARPHRSTAGDPGG